VCERETEQRADSAGGCPDRPCSDLTMVIGLTRFAAVFRSRGVEESGSVPGAGDARNGPLSVLCSYRLSRRSNRRRRLCGPLTAGPPRGRALPSGNRSLRRAGRRRPPVRRDHPEVGSASSMGPPFSWECSYQDSRPPRSVSRPLEPVTVGGDDGAAPLTTPSV
jgi:hypothetical protein